MAVFYKYQYTNKRKNIHPCIVGFPAFVGQEADDTGEVDASQQSHQNESLDNQPSIKISSKGWLAIATLKPMACQPFHKNFIYENVA